MRHEQAGKQRRQRGRAVEALCARFEVALTLQATAHGVGGGPHRVAERWSELGGKAAITSARLETCELLEMLSDPGALLTDHRGGHRLRPCTALEHAWTDERAQRR